MESKQLTALTQDLQQITDMLLLNGTLTECPGLVHGKMGIAVFFFHYAQFTNNMLFANYAIDLIGEIQEQLHVNSPADYENGLAGIGVGIDYMVRNEFLIAEDDICKEFDSRMVRAVMYDPWQDFSLYDGLSGYGRYWISRLRFNDSSLQARKCILRIVEWIEERLDEVPSNEQFEVYCFLHDLHHLSGFDKGIGNAFHLLEQCRLEWDLQSADMNRSFSRLGDSTTGNIIRKYLHNRYFNERLQTEIEVDMKQLRDLDLEKPPAKMGLLSGYAGEGLSRLTALNQTNIFWMYLL